MWAEALTWPDLIDRFGVSISVLVVFSGAVAAAAVAIWRWVTPRVDKLLDAHFTFMDSLKESFQSLERFAQKNDDRLDRMERGIGCLRPVNVDLEEIEAKLAQLKRAVK